jgi:hypothetical protein
MAGTHKRMSQQPEPTSSTLAVHPAPAPGQAEELQPNQDRPSVQLAESAQAVQAVVLPAEHPPQRIPRWLVRVELLLRVMLRMYIGLMICYAPWSPTFWDQNPVFLHFPTLSSIATNGAVRGLVSGLGFLNLWVALQDILGRREMKRER